MQAIASLNSSGEGEPTDKWCLDAKNMNSKIADAILELERSSMSDEEKKAYEEADEKIDEVSAKFEEFKAKAEQHHFIEYIWETFVPEEKKKRDKPLTEKDRDKDMKFARWIVSRVSAHIHPDKYVTVPPKKYMFEKIVTRVNKIVNTLKGLE